MEVGAFPRGYNIAPSQDLPAVFQREEDRVLEPLHWGLIPRWAKDREIARHTFNARLETVTQKPSFRQAIRTQRCLVPVSGFYEWQKQGEKKQPYYIYRADKAPLALAGLREHWVDPASDEVIDSCSIVTMAAVPPMKEIHHRMPAVVEPEHFDLWLDPEVTEPHLLQDVLKAEEHVLAMYPVSTYVSNAAHEGAKCIEPL